MRWALAMLHHRSGIVLWLALNLVALAQEPDGRIVEVGKRSFRTLRFEEGPPTVVFVPTSKSASEEIQGNWRIVPSKVARFSRVVAFERAGDPGPEQPTRAGIGGGWTPGPGGSIISLV